MRYKDVTRVDKEGRRYTWQRRDLDNVAVWIQEARHHKSQHIFTTIQTFTNNMHEEGEDSECDFFADFDGETALNDAVLMGDWFRKLGIKQADMRFWFSGNKGFHLIIPRQVFGATPSPEMHSYWRAIAHTIALKLELKSWDSTIYTKRRMWRVENTQHASSGLYKIPLTFEEMCKVPLEVIKKWAVQYKISEFEPYEEPPVQAALELYNRAVEEVKNSKILVAWEANEDVVFDKPPKCIEVLLEEGVLTLHTVNAVMFRLAAYFKSQDLSKLETIHLMNEWSANIKPSLTNTLNYDGTVNLEKLQEQIKYVCQTVYAGSNYGFSCQGILQLEGLEIYCTEECKARIEQRYEVSLFNALDVANLGRRVYIQAEAVGRRDSVMAIPESVKVWCVPTHRKHCTDCPLSGSPDGISIKIKAGLSGILGIIEPTNLPLTGRIGALFKLPDRKTCPRWKYSVKDRNCEVIYIAPRVVNAYEDSDQYTRQQIYYFGHGLTPNQGYEFTGFVHKDKRNTLKLVMDGAEPLADTLSTFEFTESMQQDSEIFRAEAKQSLEQKHDHIVSALNYNYVRIWGREKLIKVFDLVYHSVNKFWFQEELIPGWLDVLIMGDTRQGKTKAAESIMRHYNLGIRVSGESASRTGLLWTIATTEHEPAYIIWGVIPRYHKRLVVIDEIKSLIETNSFAELTDARSAGRISVSKTVFGQAQSETRCIWMTNTTGRKPMGSYFYPVQAIADLIPDGEDISRFTFAIGVASNQIDDAIINIDYDKVIPVEDKYESDVCHNHLLWVWNLKPNDIIFPVKVQRTVLRLAYQMCQEYTATIPLIEPGDFRLKLARTAVAIAARMDCREGVQLKVTNECVEYAFKFIDELYTGDSLRYFQYSDDYATYAPNDGTLKALKDEFIIKYGDMYKLLVKWIRINIYIKPKEFSSITDYDEKIIREAMTWLAAHKFLEPGPRNSYKKTAVGVSFLETLLPMDTINRASVDERLKGEDDGF